MRTAAISVSKKANRSHVNARNRYRAGESRYARNTIAAVTNYFDIDNYVPYNYVHDTACFYSRVYKSHR